MYCESKISHSNFGDVEHIKPKDLFPDLEFEWTNLGYVCSKCNNAKRAKWNGATPFINPFDEEPSDHLTAVGAFILHVNGSERGELTWREIALNRPELLQQRQERIQAILTLIDKASRTRDNALITLIKQEITDELKDDRPYAMAARIAYNNLTRAPE
jgi:hypothetical protein